MTPEDLKSLIGEIRELCIALGKSPQKEVGTSRMALNNWESGRTTNVRLKNIVALETARKNLKEEFVQRAEKYRAENGVVDGELS